MAGVEKPTKLNIHEENRGPKTAVQPEQLVAQLGLDQAQQLPRADPRRRRRSGDARWSWPPTPSCRTKTCCSFSAASSTPAKRPAWPSASPPPITWTDNQAVQVMIDGQPAVEARGLAKPQETIVYELDGKPCLRICKIADKSEAKPGEIITLHAAVRQRRRSEDRQRHDHRPPHAAARIRRRQRRAARSKPTSSPQSSSPARPSSSAGKSKTRCKSTKAASSGSRRGCGRSRTVDSSRSGMIPVIQRSPSIRAAIVCMPIPRRPSQFRP